MIEPQTRESPWNSPPSTSGSGGIHQDPAGISLKESVTVGSLGGSARELIYYDTAPVGDEESMANAGHPSREEVNAKIEAAGARLEAVESRVEARITGIDAKIDVLASKVDAVVTGQSNLSGEIKSLPDKGYVFKTVVVAAGVSVFALLGLVAAYFTTFDVGVQTAALSVHQSEEARQLARENAEQIKTVNERLETIINSLSTTAQANEKGEQ